MDKFDIEIVMPVSKKGKYRRRLLDFKKYGLVNLKDYKIKLILLTGEEKIPALFEDWHENITPVEMFWENNFVSCKLCAYYCNLFYEDLNADWYMRLDDDSITNIDGLMNALKEFDREKDQYLTTELVINNDPFELEFLKKTGVYQDGMDRIVHEQECCILSRQSILTLSRNLYSRNFLLDRLKFYEGFSDIFLNVAAKIAKIPIKQVDFLTKDPSISLFCRDIYFHIHKLAHDINPTPFNILISHFEDFYNIPQSKKNQFKKEPIKLV